MLNVLSSGEEYVNDIAMMVKVQYVLLELLALFLLWFRVNFFDFCCVFLFVESNDCFTSQTTF
jgi:hypothetical protein